MRTVGIGDYTGDGHNDILAVYTPGSDGSGDLWLYPGDLTGGSIPQIHTTVGVSGWNNMSSWGLVDWDGDGKLDIIAHDDSAHDLKLYPGTGGVFGAPSLLTHNW